MQSEDLITWMNSGSGGVAGPAPEVSEPNRNCQGEFARQGLEFAREFSRKYLRGQMQASSSTEQRPIDIDEES